jgi:hypothetical protein
MGRPPRGEAALSGAERQAAYRLRQRERRTHEAIETQRHVRAVEVRLRDAEARPKREAEEIARLKRQLELAAEEVKELKRKIAIMQNAAAANRTKKRQEQAAKDWEVIAGILDRPNGSTIPSTVRKMLGMLGSDQAGERDNAARKLEDWRRNQGKTWDDLLG